MLSLETVLCEIWYLAKAWRPSILYQSKKVIIFREVEDLIAWMVKRRDKIRAVRSPAWRYYACEGEGNRYYYLLEVSESFPSSEYLKLIAGDATDYSGHGSRDKELMETFIREILHMPIEDRPASYLIDELIGILEETRGRGGG